MRRTEGAEEGQRKHQERKELAKKRVEQRTEELMG
jgi:hypothetical protein